MEVFGLPSLGPRESVVFYIGWNKSKAEESIVTPRRAKGHRAGRTAAGRTRPGAGVIRRTCVSEQAPERTLYRGIEAGSSSRTLEYENDVHDSRRDKEMFE